MASSSMAKHVLLAAALTAIGFSAATAWAAPADGPSASKPAADTSDKALDDELMKGLTGELLEGLDEPASDAPDQPAEDAGPQEPAAEEGPKEADPADQELLDDLIGGEDVGADSESNPLGRVAGRMREAERRLTKNVADESTQKLQKQIVSELEGLIEQLKKSKSRSSSSPGMGKMRRRGQQFSQPGRQQNASRSNPSSGPSRDSSEGLRKDETQKADLAEMNRLAKELWGELPGRAGEEMRGASIEQFLPKYELLIEQYYRRLVEESSEE